MVLDFATKITFLALVALFTEELMVLLEDANDRLKESPEIIQPPEEADEKPEEPIMVFRDDEFGQLLDVEPYEKPTYEHGKFIEPVVELEDASDKLKEAPIVPPAPEEPKSILEDDSVAIKEITPGQL